MFLPGANAKSVDVVLVRGGEVLYKSRPFSDADVAEMQMNLKMDNPVFTVNGFSYALMQDTVPLEGKGLPTGGGGAPSAKLIRLTPILSTNTYFPIVLFICGVFVASFILCSLAFQRRNDKNIIMPLVSLRKETEKITEGELNTAILDQGDHEVRELATAVEQLRLKLVESVAAQKKYDDNRTFLISSISHDLKTPVTAIKGYIEGVLDGVAGTEEKRRRYLLAALNKTNLMSVMIEDLLLYSKLDLNQIPFDLEKTNLVAYMQSGVDDNLLSFEKEEKHILFEPQMPEAVVLLDQRRFRRVVQNILDNAKKYIAPKTGQVRVIIRQTPSSVVLEFADNGPGIKKDELLHIFDRFYRADSARKIEGSSGLGLAIAKQMVEGMGGRIWALSDGGTSILISLHKVDGNRQDSPKDSPEEKEHKR